MQSEQTNELSAALAKAQAQMKSVPFDRTNPHFKSKYSSLASVIDTVRKPLADNGLSYTQTTEIREAGVVLVTTLRHASGQWVASEYPLPAVAKPQELGSALTYARRYSLSALACVAADDDDDGEGARSNGQTATAAKASPIKPAPVPPPVHPETGETSPHTITAKDEMAWGGAFVAAVNAAKDENEIEEWIVANQSGLDALKSAAPTAYDRVMVRIREKRQSFKQRAA
jgi:hypothetical protein